MSVFSVNQSNFSELVLHSDKPVLLDFWATWCGPCRMLSPLVEQLSAEHPEIAVGKVNVDEEQALAEQFGIMGIPALLLFRDGKPVRSSVGYQPKNALEALLK